MVVVDEDLGDRVAAAALHHDLHLLVVPVDADLLELHRLALQQVLGAMQ
jgi:hypothetical protein